MDSRVFPGRPKFLEQRSHSGDVGLVVFFLYCSFIVVIWDNDGDSRIYFSEA